MQFHVVHALVLRYLFLFSRAPIRLAELMFWPLMNLLVWGNLTVYMQQRTDPSRPAEVTFLFGAVILWDVLFRSQQGVAVFFLEDVWSRNLLNIFAAPVRIGDYLAATYMVGLLRSAITVTLLAVLTWFLYAFDIFRLGFWLLPFVGNLMIFGWALGMISTALILRFGPAAETLAWAIPFFIQPFAAVFYTVESMPSWMQKIANILPCTHVFEGMRTVLVKGRPDWSSLLWATALNIVLLALAGWLFAHIMKVARERGLITKFATQ
ncbi:MAG: ABC transporter permease [Verrucomicrobiales bacterium]